MKYFSALILASLCLTLAASAQTSPSTPPLRVAIAGLVHGHVEGFFKNSLHRTDIQLVAIAEPDQLLASRYATQFGRPQPHFRRIGNHAAEHASQAVLAYTSTYDHRRVVEICARHGVPVMMEKPLAVSAEDAHAMEYAALKGKIQVLVNYETTWYRSNRAAYDLARKKTIGDIRKIVVHDGHRGPKEIGVQPEFFAWLTDPKLDGGGALFDFGCYGADLATWLMGNRRPTTVTAVTQQIKPDIYPRVDDEATIILTYPKAQAIIQASWNWPFDRKDLEVYGQTGYAITVARDDVRVRLQGKEDSTSPPSPFRLPRMIHCPTCGRLFWKAAPPTAPRPWKPMSSSPRSSTRHGARRLPDNPSTWREARPWPSAITKSATIHSHYPCFAMLIASAIAGVLVIISASCSMHLRQWFCPAGYSASFASAHFSIAKLGFPGEGFAAGLNPPAAAKTSSDILGRSLCSSS